MTRYDYKKLEERALSTGAPEDLERLGNWFFLYGAAYWNGEYFEIDKDNRLYPVFNPDTMTVDGWVLK